MTRSKINFRSLHIQMKLFLTPHCPTPKSKWEFLTLRIYYLKYQGAYINKSITWIVSYFCTAINKLLIIYILELSFNFNFFFLVTGSVKIQMFLLLKNTFKVLAHFTSSLSSIATAFWDFNSFSSSEFYSPVRNHMDVSLESIIYIIPTLTYRSHLNRSYQCAWEYFLSLFEVSYLKVKLIKSVSCQLEVHFMLFSV